MSDSRHFDMTGVGHELALPVAFGSHKATHWFQTPRLGRPINTTDKSHPFNWETYKTQYQGAETRQWPQAVEARLVLCWTKPDRAVWEPAGFSNSSIRDNRPDLRGTVIALDISAFPGKGIGPDEAWPMIKAWLDETDYGPEPDTDGHNGKGYRIFCEGCGYVCGMWQAFVGIEPAWLTYGK